jgi:sialate O-acetylesterase
MKIKTALIALIAGGLFPAQRTQAVDATPPWTVFADFETETYEPWTVEGTAFGTAPTEGAPRAEQKLSGFQGQRLANSYPVGGDGAVGKLVSPEFVIDRPILAFLVGGGKHAKGADETVNIHLLVDGEVVCSATGSDSDIMGWVNWDVSELAEKKGQIVIEDTATGSWGHIEVDQIVFSSVKMPAFAMASPFSDHMVLQRDKPVTIWGTALAGQTVRVRFGGQVKETTTDQNRRWRVTLDPMPASADPRNLIAEALGEFGGKQDFSDVLVGEVWLASGQSNMEFDVRGCIDGPAVAAATQLPGVRFLLVPRRGETTPQDTIALPAWKPATNAQDVGSFSAVAFFFARQLHERLGVPVGVIQSAFGNTPAEAWTSMEILSGVPVLKQGMEEDFANLAAIDADPVKAADPARFILPFARTGSLFNAMINPIVPYTIRGAIWYQGESNAFRADYYSTLLPMMIADWRARFGQGDFPFYLVQLANYYDPVAEPPPTNIRTTDDWVARLREAQVIVTKTVPNTAMAVAIDIGEKDIHPKNKQDVGDRLARVALARTYDLKDVEYESPVYASMERQGAAMQVKFEGCPSGLMVGSKIGLEPTQETPEAKLSQFAIAGVDRKFVWADARVEGKDTVLVSSPAVPEPVAVRYAWSINPEGANLYGKNGLPASPFRTDDWPLPKN